MKFKIVRVSGEYRLKLIESLFISLVSIFLITAAIVEAGQIVGHSTPIDDGSYCTVEFRYGSINWTTGIILATGRTSSQNGANTELDDSYALKSAKNSAIDHMVEILNAIGLPGKYKTSEPSPSLSQSPPSSEEATQSIHMIISQIKKKAIKYFNNLQI